MLPFRILAGHRRDVDRRRQVIDQRVQQRLHALVAEGGAHQHRHRLPGDRGPPQGRAQQLGGHRLFFQVRAHRLVVDLGDGFDHRGACRLGRFTQVVRDLGPDRRGAQRVVFPLAQAHADQIDDAREVLFQRIRQLDDDRVAAQPLANLGHTAVRLGADPVALVDEGDARHVVLVRLPPHRLGLGLDAGDRVEHRHGAVQHAQAALDFDREVDVSGGVDDVDPVLAPKAGGRGRGDGDPALLLLLHPVHLRGPLVHLAHFARHARIEEDPLGGRGLPRVDVRHDSDVPDQRYGR